MTFYADEIWEQLDAGRIGDYMNKGSVRYMLVKHKEGQGDYARKIWAIYIFSLWQQIFVEADGDFQEGPTTRTSQSFKHLDIFC